MHKKIKIPNQLKKVNEIFVRNGFKAYLVGGAVRDSIMGIKAHDYDIATDAEPQEVMKMFNRVIPTGIAHGTVTIHIFGMELETTTFRTDCDYTDGRHPDKVIYAKNIEEDLSRRDFTINAIAADLGTGIITDPFNGIEDIKNKIIKTVGSPEERFTEDGLRPVRAIRFSSQLGFSIADDTLKAISNENVLAKTKGISVERFRDEFCKILTTPVPSVGLKLLESTGILDMFIPDFKVCRGCLQQDYRGFHEFDVADHLLYSTDGAPRNNLTVRLAAFFHDIGKPESKTTELIDGKEVIHFHNHESKSAEKTKKIMTDLKFSNDDIEKVSHLVKEHMFYYESTWTNAAVRRFIIRVGTENFENLILLRLADIHGMHNCPLKENSPTWLNILELKERIKTVQEQNTAMGLKDLKVNGKDLMQEGIPSGKDLGAVLKELFETVTESPEMNEKEKLLTLAKNIYNEKYRR